MTSEEERLRQREIILKNSKVPYERLHRAEAQFQAEFPDADRVHAGLYGAGIYVEVWKRGGAKIYPYGGE